ncbi:MAG: DUF5711 family protein [Lachnospiraceae bacterium]|nr:DUF5711 family protein [Lachnospiraceae bacterium]
MNKDKWQERFQKIKERLSFLGFTDYEDLDDLSDVTEMPLYGHEEEDGLSFRERLRRNRQRRWLLRGLVVIILVGVVAAFYTYNQTHTFEDYIISKSIDNTVTSGTQYVEAEKYLYRYNTDGVTCVNLNNEVEWSITYSMQAPIVDICGTTMVIAEQQGTQVYVVNEDGLLGNFTCLLPILKVRVSNQGVVAVVLQDDDVTWVRLYDANGESIANDKTTISDSGYPLDVDLSPNGEKMVVSYLGILEGVMTSTIVFYDFGSEGDSSLDYVVNSETISGNIVPQVYFTDNTTAAAIADNGFLVFKGSILEKSVEYWFDDEIVSCFYDDDTIGFLFLESSGESIYRMELYNYRGKQKVSVGVDTNFDTVKMENGQILMYTSSSVCVYTKKGRLRFSSAYEKEITDIFYFSEYRRYLVITRDSFDRIRIC